MLYTAKDQFHYSRRGVTIRIGDVIELSDEELEEFSRHPGAFELVPGQKKPMGRPPNAPKPAED
jgi:hypothetical protein